MANLESADGQDPPERVDYDCYHLCGQCGYLARGAEGACPSCDTRSWMDLANHATADTVRDMDEAERHSTPAWVTAVMVLAVLACGAGAYFAAGGSVAAAVAACAVLGVVCAVVRKPLTALLMRAAENRPVRWRLPVPLKDAQTEAGTELRGTASPVGEALVAPFSGRSCLAYQVSAVFFAAHDARPPQWILHEAAGADFEVGGDTVDGSRVMVRAPLQAIEREALETGGQSLKQFLRERGLFAADGSFELFEAILEPGAGVRVEVPGAGQPITVSLDRGDR